MNRDRLAPRLALPGWTGRSDVQRVDFYTRSSLYLVFWFLLLVGIAGAVGSLARPVDRLVVLVSGLVLGVLGTWLVRAAFALYPQAHPVPRREVLALLAAAVPVGVWVFRLPDEEVFAPALILVGTLAWALGGLRDRRFTWGVVLLGGLVMGGAALDLGLAAYGAGMAAFFVFTVQSSLWLLGVVTELDRARSSQAALAVAEERLRFSRDVHDVLGRHLSTIAVQAELAATMAERGDARAPELVREVRGTAHTALREARELARGYRPLDLGQELEGAVSLLESAGIRASADLDGLPEGWHAPVARVVREAVTNVLRHSAATRVEIGYADGVVEVRNDGVSDPGSTEGDGSGLSTLATELAGLGAVLTHRRDGERFVLRLALAGDEVRA